MVNFVYDQFSLFRAGLKFVSLLELILFNSNTVNYFYNNSNLELNYYNW